MQSVMPFITTWSGMAKQSARGCRLTRSVILGDTFVEISLRTKDYHEALKKVAELVPITQARTAEEERQTLIQHTQITLLREVTPAVVAEYAAYLRRQPLSI